MSCNTTSSFIDKRRAGVLLHPTCLPGPQFCGDLGPNAYRFVEWMARAGLSVWQMLPLNPTPADGSPYQCQSSFAGNIALISIEQLIIDGWLDNKYSINGVNTLADIYTALTASLDQFNRQSHPQQQQQYNHFCETHKDWLN
ncbi:MAG TPA: 4-alpha-glucanotransferase, partial [Pseudomonadales bacterium]|nr:4-alpha-glucanotransferase [Pseudomonadales bacterium]